MRPNVSALLTSTLTALGYLAAVAVTGYVIAAVRTAVDQWRTAGEITGPVLSRVIGDTAPTASPWAWIAVDVVVLLLCWRAWGAPAGGAAALDRNLMVWVLAAVTGLQLAYFALTRLLDSGGGWLVVPARAQDTGLDSLTATPTSLVLLAVVHPVAVELLFRGVITDRLGSVGLTVPVVVAWSALLFAIVQPTVPLAIVGAVFGLAAGALRHRTGSVAAAVAAHYAFVFAGAVVWAGTGLIATEGALMGAVLAGAVLAGTGALLAAKGTRPALPPGGAT